MLISIYQNFDFNNVVVVAEFRCFFFCLLLPDGSGQTTKVIRKCLFLLAIPPHDIVVFVRSTAWFCFEIIM